MPQSSMQRAVIICVVDGDAGRTTRRVVVDRWTIGTGLAVVGVVVVDAETVVVVSGTVVVVVGSTNGSTATVRTVVGAAVPGCNSDPVRPPAKANATVPAMKTLI